MSLANGHGIGNRLDNHGDQIGVRTIKYVDVRTPQLRKSDIFVKVFVCGAKRSAQKPSKKYGEKQQKPPRTTRTL